MATTWLQSTYNWDSSTLQAKPAKATGTRKGSAAGGASQVCQVDGCGADLTGLRYFFRKQRICEQHARADVVTDSAGHQLRFCQQCTRLEPLSNFLAGRRSCRTSLAKRQARAHRGKAHSSPDSSPERGYGYASRGRKPVVSTATNSSLNSDNATGSAAKAASSRRSGGGQSCKRSRAGSPPSDGGLGAGLGVGGEPPSPMLASMASPVSLTAHGGQASNGSTRFEAASAASLPLPAPAQHPGYGAAGFAGPGPAAVQMGAQQVQQLPAQQCAADVDSMMWSDALGEHELEELLAMDPDALADALLVSPPPLNGVGAGGNSGLSDASQQAWLPGAGQQAAQMWGAAAAAPQPVFPSQAQPGLHSMAAMGGDLGGVAAEPMQASMAAVGGGAGLPGGSAAAGLGWATHPVAAQAEAMQQSASGVAAAVQHVYPSHVVTRFSLKIFGVNPDHLPPALRTELLAALQVSPTVLEGAIRCGCTHLIVDVLMSREERQRLAAAPCLAAAVQHLRRADIWGALPAPPAMVAQLGPLVALGTAQAGAQAGGALPPPPLPCIHLGAAELLPQLQLESAIATTTSAAAGRFLVRVVPAPSAGGGACSASELAAALRCRSHGRLVGLAVSTQRGGRSSSRDSGRSSEFNSDSELECFSDEGSLMDDEEARWQEDWEESSEPDAAQRPGAADGDAPPSARAGCGGGSVVLEAWAPDAGKPECWGLYELEATSGSLLSQAVPVLVLPDSQSAAAAALCQAQQQEAAGRMPAGAAATIVRLVAAVLRYLQQRQAAAEAGPGSAAAAAFAAAYPPTAAIRLASVARRLVALAVRARWPAVAALMLPAISADGAVPEAAVQQVDALAAPAPTMLHLAVASGAAASLASLRSWAESQGIQWTPPQAEGGAEAADAPACSPLLLAAAMGTALSRDMTHQLIELLGPEGLARQADACGPDGWTPRRVAEATGCSALLAALPPAPAAATADEPVAAAAALKAYAAAAAAAGEEEEEEELLSWQAHKLAAMDDEWASCAAGSSKAAAPAALPSRTPSDDLLMLGGKAAARQQPPPSHDAKLLAVLLDQMHVPAEGRAAAAPQQQAGLAAQPWAARGLLSSPLLRTSMAGATAAVVAALASVAIRMSALWEA